MATPTRNILIRLPVQIANRLDSLVPRRKRNQFIVNRVAEVIGEHDEKLAQIAMLVTKEEKENAELGQTLSDWDAVIGDGIEDKTIKNDGI